MNIRECNKLGSMSHFIGCFSGYKFSQCNRIERLCYSVTHPGPEIFCFAGIEKAANLAHLALGSADHRRDRTFKNTYNLAHRDLLRRATQAIATMSTTGTDNKRRFGFAQQLDQLL